MRRSVLILVLTVMSLVSTGAHTHKWVGGTFQEETRTCKYAEDPEYGVPSEMRDGTQYRRRYQSVCEDGTLDGEGSYCDATQWSDWDPWSQCQ
mgnify:CR=1 FL=1